MDEGNLKLGTQFRQLQAYRNTVQGINSNVYTMEQLSAVLTTECLHHRCDNNRRIDRSCPLYCFPNFGLADIMQIGKQLTVQIILYEDIRVYHYYVANAES